MLYKRGRDVHRTHSASANFPSTSYLSSGTFNNLFSSSRFNFPTMADAINFSSRPQYCHDVFWYPLSYRWPGVIFNQHFGLPPLLDPRDLSWMESIFRRLGTSAWPGYSRSPALAPFGQAVSKLHRELSGGVSEVASEMCKWKISLDVNHFAPSEITVKIQDGFLEIAGMGEMFFF